MQVLNYMEIEAVAGAGFFSSFNTAFNAASGVNAIPALIKTIDLLSQNAVGILFVAVRVSHPKIVMFRNINGPT